MNKIFINLLLALGFNFSLCSSERDIRYDDHDNPTIQSLKVRAKEIDEFLKSGKNGTVWIVHTKYVLDVTDPMLDKKIEEIKNFLDRIKDYDSFVASRNALKICDTNGIQNDQRQTSSPVEESYSKVWSERRSTRQILKIFKTVT